MAKKNPDVNVVLEYAGKQFPAESVKDFLLAKVKAMLPDVKIKNLGIYLQPEMDVVFYTVNGEGSPDWCIPFDELAV